MKKEELSSTKGQIYWIDYILSFFLFLIMLSIFILAIDNYTAQDDISISEISNEANFIAKTLLQEGSPVHWKAENFSRAGLRENGYISKQRIYEFEKLGYDEEKNALRMKYDFAIAFTNGSKAIQNLGGICAIGKNITSNATNNIAYYYRNSETGFIKDNVSQIFSGELFNLANQSDFFEHLNNFTLIILDNPIFQSGGGYTFSEKKQIIEDFAAHGNNIILSGFPGGDMLGMEFIVDSGNNVTLIGSNPGLDLSEGENISMEYKSLVNGTCTKLGTDENELAGIATWKFGNGTVFYFSNFTFSGNGNMKTEIIKTIRYNIIGKCGSVSFKDIGEKMLVRVERLCLVGDRVMNMEVYSWQ